ncbi:MAG: hypothetical protein BKP49_08960 [Treponema sp. CETP13]|nr:MAG: hypothetical protein BKP49_08960 [Treponema sp. CETP13]
MLQKSNTLQTKIVQPVNILFKLKKIISFCFFLTFFMCSIFSEQTSNKVFSENNFRDLFNNNLSEENIIKLKDGKEVMIRLESAELLSLKPITKEAEKTLKSVKTLNPSYLMEIIKIIPKKNHENLISTLNGSFLEIENYNGIPYYSESKKRWEDLFSDAHVVKKSKSNNVQTVTINLKMDPFGKFNADLVIIQNKDSLEFTLQNQKNLRIIGVPVVKPQNMLCTVYAFEYNDNWILYGTGGVLAPKVPVLGSKAEVSFVNRISTFCRYIFNTLE